MHDINNTHRRLLKLGVSSTLWDQAVSLCYGKQIQGEVWKRERQTEWFLSCEDTQI